MRRLPEEFIEGFALTFVLVAFCGSFVFITNSCTKVEEEISWSCYCDTTCDEHSGYRTWPPQCALKEDRLTLEVDMATSCFAELSSYCEEYTCACECLDNGECGD